MSGRGFPARCGSAVERIRLSDPRIDHTANCANCMNRILALRREIRRTEGSWPSAWLLLVWCHCRVIGWFRFEVTIVANHGHVAPVSKLWICRMQAHIAGEQPGQLQSVICPPRRWADDYSSPIQPPGQYLVAVTRDQSGNGVIAEGLASTVANGRHQQITADVHLRNARAGQYFLSTTHEQDQAAYYYPLQIK